MKLKDFLDNPFEIFWWGCTNFPIVLYVQWWVIPIMILSGLLGRLGGTEGGHKLFRKIGDPILVCGATYLKFHEWGIFIAIPFMVWLAPAYGATSWLFKLMTKLYGRDKADMPTRLIILACYWAAYLIALSFRF